MRQQLRLRISRFGKALLEHQRDLVVQLIASALKQRLVRGILHQSMFEGVLVEEKARTSDEKACGLSI